MNISTRAIAMLVAEAAYKAGSSRDKAVDSETLRNIVNDVIGGPDVHVDRIIQQPVARVSEESFSSDGTSDIITINLPIGTALYTAQDEYKVWYDEAIAASNAAGFVGMSAAQVIEYQDMVLRENSDTISDLKTVLAMVIDVAESHIRSEYTGTGMLDELLAELAPVREVLGRKKT